MRHPYSLFSSGKKLHVELTINPKWEGSYLRMYANGEELRIEIVNYPTEYQVKKHGKHRLKTEVPPNLLKELGWRRGDKLRVRGDNPNIFFSPVKPRIRSMVKIKVKEFADLIAKHSGVAQGKLLIFSEGTGRWVEPGDETIMMIVHDELIPVEPFPF